MASRPKTFFALPITKERPAIVIVTQAELVAKRLQQNFSSEGAAHVDPSQRRVVALYDDRATAIFLTDDWTGTSPADRSILVHEMVHHIQGSNTSARWLERSQPISSPRQVVGAIRAQS